MASLIFSHFSCQQEVEQDTHFLLFSIFSSSLLFPHTFAHTVHLTCIHIHQLLFRPWRTRLCMHDHQAHMLMRSTSLPAHAAYRLLPASIFVISKRTPRRLTCTLLSLSSPVPHIPLHPPQGSLASPQYSSPASCYHFPLLLFCPLLFYSDFIFTLVSFFPSVLFPFASFSLLLYQKLI